MSKSTLGCPFLRLFWLQKYKSCLEIYKYKKLGISTYVSLEIYILLFTIFFTIIFTLLILLHEPKLDLAVFRYIMKSYRFTVLYILLVCRYWINLYLKKYLHLILIFASFTISLNIIIRFWNIYCFTLIYFVTLYQCSFRGKPLAS